MRSNFLAGNPVLRKALPWILWGVAALIAIPLGYTMAGIGTVPALIDSHTAILSAPRTRQRLRVAEVLVTPGQPVKKDQLMVRMDTAEMDADLAIARAKQNQFELEARALEAKLGEEHARDTQRFATGAERASLEMSRIVAELEQDRSELVQLDETIAREQKLVSEQLASAEFLNELRLKRAALAKKVEEYRNMVVEARKGAAGSAKRLTEWLKKHPAVVTDENSALALQVAPAKAAVETQKQEVRRLEILRDQYFLRAPFAGRVGDIFLQVAQLSADPETPIVTVVEETSRKAIAYADQNKAGNIHVGDAATLVPRDLRSSRLQGRVVAMAPSITEIPIRLRKLPNIPEFGRNVYIELDQSAALPGLGFDASFSAGTGEKP